MKKKKKQFEYPSCETEAAALLGAAKVDLCKAIDKLTRIVTRPVGGKEDYNMSYIANRTNELMGILGKFK